MNEAFPMAAPERMVPQSHVNERPEALAATLGRIELALETAVGSESPLVARFRGLHRRLDQERLQLAVLGQFKRGKSTFINALLGDDVLPTGVIPLTAVATFIAWRREPLVVVRFKGEAPTEEFAVHTADEIRNVLFRFVAEEANPENRLGVERVDLFYPASILADGTVIIDTPGVGSTLRHNTEAALQVLPESDAAFFVVSADPPITEVELEYLRRLKSKTSARVLHPQQGGLSAVRRTAQCRRVRTKSPSRKVSHRRRWADLLYFGARRIGCQAERQQANAGDERHC